MYLSKLQEFCKRKLTSYPFMWTGDCPLDSNPIIDLINTLCILATIVEIFRLVATNHPPPPKKITALNREIDGSVQPC